MTVTATAESKTSSFPVNEATATLQAELLNAVQSIAEMNEIALPIGAKAQSVFRIQIDSLTVVEILCELEPIMGFELRDSLVRTGGYRSIDECVGHLIPRLQKDWEKHKAKKATK